jgi:hypothetical protein
MHIKKVLHGSAGLEARSGPSFQVLEWRRTSLCVGIVTPEPAPS